MTTPGLTMDPSIVVVEADRIAGQGRHRDAIDRLVTANREERSDLVEKALVRMRHEAAVHDDEAPGPEAWPAAYPDLFAATDGIPEIDATDLSAETIGAGLLNHGSLIVRRLLTEERATRLVSGIDAALAAFDEVAANPRLFEVLPWYSPIQVGDGYSWEPAERVFPRSTGAVMVADSPRMLFEVIEAYREVGLGKALHAYLGERPAVSVKKFTLRRTEPSAQAGWHQDGAFLGAGVRSANVWVSLTESGTDAPGLDIVPRRFDDFVEQVSDTSGFSWLVTAETANEVAGGRIASPVFEPGDAVILDQLTLHRTGVRPTMTMSRHAIESWFFAPSSFPHEQIPVAF